LSAFGQAKLSIGNDLVLGVKDKILPIDLPHELRAKFDRLIELLFGPALRDRSSDP
jgi:hypothetical protein